MASGRRLKERFAFASCAVHAQRRSRRPALEVLEGRALLSTFTVNSLGDAGSGSGNSGDLRYCVSQANANDQANSIVFDSTLFSTPQTITLSGSQLALTDPAGTQTITGPAAAVTISGGGNSRVFQVDPGVTASISGLTISGGSAVGAGGGLVNYGTTTLTDCTLSGNTVVDPGGNYTLQGDGGAVFNGQTAPNSDGKTYGAANLTLTDCTLSGNTASSGGAFCNSGMAYLTDCTLSGNSAFQGGGAFNNNAANLTLTDCTVSGNSGSGSGGGLVNDGATITLYNCTISGNSEGSAGGGGGGALANYSGTANLSDCTLSGNSAYVGGGVYNSHYSGTVNLTACTVSGNFSQYVSQYAGGGLQNGGTANLTDTIVSGNTDPSGASDITGSDVTGSFNLVGTGGSGGLGNGQSGNIVLTSLTGFVLAPLGNNGGPTQTIALLPGSPAIGAGVIADYPGTTTPITTDQRGEPLDTPDPDIGAFQTQPGTLITLSFSGISDQSITFGTSSVTISGTLAAGSQAPVGETVAVTLDSVQQSAAIGSGGAFSTTFDTAGLTVAKSPYMITYVYISDGTYASAGTTSTLTVNPATLTIFTVNSLGDAGIGSGDSGDLRYCINQANTDDGANTIVFDPTVFSTPQTITLSGVQLELEDTGGTQTITGPAAGVTLSGGGNSSVISGGDHRVFKVDSGVTASLSGLTISGGSAGFPGFGGGLANYGGTVTLTECTISGNSATEGGGVFNAYSGTANLTGCTLSGNYTLYGQGGGGGMQNNGTANLTDCTLSGNYSGLGGGGVENGGTANLTDCTLSGNSGFAGGLLNYSMASLSDCTLSGNSAVSGGGVRNKYGTANLTDCTLSGNSSGYGGGGVANYSGTANLTACTISGNTARDGGGLANYAYDLSPVSIGPANLIDTIVAGNTSDIAGSDVSGSNNLIGTGGSGGLVNGQSGNIVLTSLTDLGLTPLGNFGGPTQTMAVLPGSPALGAGTAVTGVTTDQRGEPLDAPNPDIGAFQSQGFTLTPIAGSTPQSTAIGTAFANPLAVTVATNNPVEPVAGGVLTFTAPSSGPSTNLSAATATIGPDGIASVTATASDTAGSYAVTASAGGAATTDFALTNTGTSLTPLNFSGISNPSITYGTSSVTVSGTLSSGSQAPVGETVAVTLGSVQQSATIGADGAFSTTFDTTRLTVANSPDTITYAYTSDGTFASASTTSTLTVNPAMLTITANAETKAYGTADPALAYTASGFQFSDIAGSVLTGALARAQAGNLAGEQAGGYAISLGTLAANSNYTISFTGNTLTISPAPLTVTANPQTKVYGNADSTLTDTATGFVDTTVDGVTIDDTAASALSGSLSRAQSGTLAGEQVGVYAISQGTLAAGANYTIAFTGSTLTVTPAPLTVTANPETKFYGTADPTPTQTATGFVDTAVDGVTIDDTAATALTGHLTRAAGETVSGGSYAITQGTLVASNNYTMTFTGSTLAITPAPLTVTVNPQTKVYGTADPTLTDTANGFVDTTVDGVTIDDTAATALTGSLARAQLGTASGERVGGYAIRQGTLAASNNYTMTFTGGTLSITPAPLTVTANPQTKVYGTADPALTDTPAGLVDQTVDGVTIDDTAATVLTGALARAQFGTASGEQVGDYAISQGTLAAGANYTIAFTGSTLTITPAPLTVTGNPETKVYGTADPTLTETASGFVDTTVDGVTIDDTPATALSGRLTRTAGETVSGGPYAITQGTLAASNYTITFTGSTLIITPAPLTVAANPETKVYGSADPTLTDTASGLIDAAVDGVAIDDTAATALTGHLTRTPGETVSGGPYAITHGTLADSKNYTMTFTGSTLAIIPAPLAVTANPQTKIYGTADPTLTDTATGFVDAKVDGVTIDDTAATALAGHLARTAGETVSGGPYAITRDTLAADSNYTITFTGSTLAITPATLLIVAEPETKVFGSADPTLAYTPSGFQFSDTAATVLTGSPARAAGGTVSGGPYAITQGTLASDSNYTVEFTGSTLTITPATPLVTESAKSGNYGGAPIAAAATVKGVSGTATPDLEGVMPTVTYYAGSGTSGTDLGSSAPSTAGTYTVVARFPGSANYAAAQSKPATFVIAPAVSTIRLTSPSSSPIYGQSVTFVATVNSVGGAPGGTVSFADGTIPLATAPLDSSGQAALTISTLSLGSHAITATYNGGTDFLAVISSTAAESVSQSPTAIVLVPREVLKGKKLNAVGLTAAIEPVAPGGGVPTGAVTFEFIKKQGRKVKVTRLGTAALSGGAATLTFRPNQVLNKPLTIVYSGDPDFLASSMSPTRLTKSGIASSRT